MVGWAFSHLPLFFYEENYMAMGIGGLILFFVSMFAGAILLTWLYNSTNGSILMVALWHGALNAATASADSRIQMVYYTIIWIAAVTVVVVARPANLSCSGRHTI